MEQLVIIGAGGFGREVLDIIEAINFQHAATGEAAYEVLGFLDDGDPDERLLKPYGVQHIGPVSDLAGMSAEVGYVIGIGSPQARAALDREYADQHSSPVLVHPSATIGRNVDLGPGTIVCSHVSLTNHITIGRHVHVNINSTVGHDAVLGDHVTLSPLVGMSGNVHAEARSFFGTGAKINPGVTVGEDAVVGTGAAVIRDVEPGTTVVGVPAKPRS